MRKNLFFTGLFLCLCASPLAAQLSTPAVISSDMVLQQGRPVPVWGKALPGERITVSYGGQRVKASTGADSCWQVSLGPMPADATPRTMTIKGKRETLTYTNVVVGEVWIASGQSNMEYSMRRHKAFVAPAHGVDSSQIEMRKPANPMIRVYVSARKGQKPWAEASGESLPQVSTVGYYFAKSLQQALGVPVGIVTAALGGTRIETWTPREAYEASPVFAGEIAKSGKIDGWGTGGWYDTFVAPLVPMAVRGFLWYQGENNCGIGDRRYAEKFKVMTGWWRNAFGAAGAPFYYVLLAPHVYSDRMHRGGRPQTAEALPLFRQQQIEARDMVANSDYVSVSDLVDDIHDIHPSYKWTVGARLARMALAGTYGRTDIVCRGPRLSRAVAAGRAVNVVFSDTAGGLRTSDGKRVSWFEVAGADGVFRPAVADICGKDTVAVYCSDIREPRYVRFGWHETAAPNLENSSGLPAVPFAAVAAEQK